MLFQSGREVARFDLTNPQKVADLLNDFFAYTEPDIQGFEQAVQEFKERSPTWPRGWTPRSSCAQGKSSFPDRL